MKKKIVGKINGGGGGGGGGSMPGSPVMPPTCSRGVAILVRNSVSIKVNSCFKDPNGRVLILQAVVNNSALTLVNLYAPNNDDPDFLFRSFW